MKNIISLKPSEAIEAANETLLEYIGRCRALCFYPQKSDRSSRGRLVVSHDETIDSLQTAADIICRKLNFASLANFTQYLVGCAVNRLKVCPQLVTDAEYEAALYKSQAIPMMRDLLKTQKSYQPIRLSASKMRLLAWDEAQADSISGLLKNSGQYQKWVIQWFCCEILAEFKDILDPKLVAELQDEGRNGRFLLYCYRVGTIELILKYVM